MRWEKISCSLLALLLGALNQHTRAILSKTSVNKEETLIAAEKTQRTEMGNKNDANDKFSNRRLNRRKEDKN